MTTLPVPVDAVASAATALLRAARFDEAGALLGDHPGLARFRAELALAQDFLHSRATADEPLAAVEAEATGPEERWYAGFLRLRQHYAAELFAPGTEIASADGRDPAAIAALLAEATGLVASAPDRNQAGWAKFYAGIVCDNIGADHPAGRGHLSAALAAAEATGDDYLCFESLRHLGMHALEDDGDPTAARACWERSASAAARAGGVTQVLGQQVYLAELAALRGDAAGARLLAGEVVRWSDAVGAERIGRQARGVLAAQG